MSPQAKKQESAKTVVAVFVLMVFITAQFVIALNFQAGIDAKSNTGAASVSGSSVGGAQSENSGAEQSSGGSPARWWESWTRDLNRNKIDDVLEYKILTREYTLSQDFIVALDFDHKPTASDVAYLSQNGAEIQYVAQFIDTVIISAPYKTIQAFLERSDIVMAEDNTVFTATLDTSVPSIGADKVKTTLGFTGKGVVVAVIDTGIDAKHQSIDDMDDNPATNDPKVIGFFDAVNSKNTSYDDNGHGTHCAGIVAGTGAPGYKYVGMAPGAKLVGVKVLSSQGSGTMQQVVKGIEWATANKDKFKIKVISMSLGAQAVPFRNDGNSAESRAVAAAVDAGITTVIAAGNAGPQYESIGSPGDAQKAITVGSAKDDHVLSTFSSRGPCGAPGSTYIKPDICAPGELVISAAANSMDNYISASGTSMATPHVAGMVALMLEAKNTLKPDDVKAALAKNAGKQTKTEGQRVPNNDYGWGVIDAYATIKDITGK